MEIGNGPKTDANFVSESKGANSEKKTSYNFGVF